MYTWTVSGRIISLIIRTAKNGKPYLSVGVKYAESRDAVAWHIAWSTDFAKVEGMDVDAEGRVNTAFIGGTKVSKDDEVTLTGPVSHYGEGAAKKTSMPIKRADVHAKSLSDELVGEAMPF
jgi:hypothetical protein